jgi:trimethylamine--corrinoid protein Co-methyltransferase
MEVGFSTLLATLNGQNLIHDIGFLESALITSYEMYVLTNEAIGMAKFIAGGVDVSDDTLAAEVIDSVGPFGDFLCHEHTLRSFRREFHFPGLLDRTNYAGWERQGARTMDQRLKTKVDEILATHVPAPIAEEPRRLMADVLKRVEARLGGAAT